MLLFITAKCLLDKREERVTKRKQKQLQGQKMTKKTGTVSLHLNISSKIKYYIYPNLKILPGNSY